MKNTNIFFSFYKKNIGWVNLMTSLLVILIVGLRSDLEKNVGFALFFIVLYVSTVVLWTVLVKEIKKHFII